MSLDNTHSVRFISITIGILLIAGMLISSPSVRADVPDLTIGETERIYFDWDFEQEVVGTMPDAGWFALGTTMTHANISITTTEDDGNQVIEFEADGLTPEDVKGYANIGYTCVGFVNFSIDFNLVDYNWTLPWDTTDGKIDFGLFPSASISTCNARLTVRNETHANIWVAGAGAVVPVERDAWHTMSCIYDTDSDTIEWYVDEVYVTTQNYVMTHLLYVGFSMEAHTQGDGQYIKAYFDNVVVSQTVDVTTSFCDISDDRTAISIVFDDGYESAYELAFPVMGDDSASTAIITYYTDNELPYDGKNTTNWTELNEMQDAGWEVLSHSNTHVLFGESSEEAQRSQLSIAKGLIESNMGGTCRGFIYPGSSRSESTDAIAYEYHEYLRISGKDMPQITINTKYAEYNRSLTDWGFFTFGSYIPAAVYGHYGYLGMMAHHINESAPYDTYDMGYDAFTLWIGKLQENNSRFVTPNEYWLEWRNAWYAELTTDGSNLNIDYPDDGINRTFDDVWVRFSQGWMYGVGTWYLDDEYSYGHLDIGDYSPYLRAVSGSIMEIEFTSVATDSSLNGQSAMGWSVDFVGDSASIAFEVHGLDAGLGYRVYLDDTVIATGTGSSFSFNAVGEGDFEIIVWYVQGVSSLVVLTVNMVGLGIIVAVLASYVVPIARDIQEKRPIKPEELTQNLIRTVIFIVVATLMWGVLHTIAIG